MINCLLFQKIKSIEKAIFVFNYNSNNYSYTERERERKWIQYIWLVCLVKWVRYPYP